ncbi:hypothetical protein V1525DRAFT_408206 [Lipomyces kononenkoae]|uniref:Uncharacterized protein n=1 Tax=Lipomyces kononenkoae TaxID=34357 RepID=A0ACC3SX75_LIPKO
MTSLPFVASFIMTPGLDLAPKRTRESTSKVRTGCSTCKARRVKCDEAKPICRRCAVGGRKCESNTERTTTSKHGHGISASYAKSTGILRK